MDSARRRGLRRSAAVVAACSAVLLASSTAAGPPAPEAGTLRVLQLNLCNSGIASCYTGRSVSRAAEVIRASAPDVVTLNEVCRDDVDQLGQIMGERAGGRPAWAFTAASDRRTGGAFRCRNGQPFGIGVLVRLPDTARGYASSSGIYPVQDLNDPEERAFLCVRAVGTFDACTTHLASTSASVARAQCRHLLTDAVPAARALDRNPVVVGGDFNLVEPADVRACVPPGYVRADDGLAQQVIASSEFAVRSTALIDMRGTTDHPGLLVTLTLTGGAGQSHRQTMPTG